MATSTSRPCEEYNCVATTAYDITIRSQLQSVRTSSCKLVSSRLVGCSKHSLSRALHQGTKFRPRQESCESALHIFAWVQALQNPLTCHLLTVCSGAWERAEQEPADLIWVSFREK